MADKFCKDCHHSRASADGDPYQMRCAAPQNTVPSVDTAKYLVSGIEQPVVMATRGWTCTALRMKRDPAVEALTCGPDGKWFDAKERAS